MKLNFKKAISLLMCMLIVFACGAVYADTVTEAGYYSFSAQDTNVYIEGNLSSIASSFAKGVTLTLIGKGDKSIKYIDQISVSNDGIYKTKFKFRGDISNVAVSVKTGISDVTESVTLSYAEKPVIASVKLKADDGSNVIKPGDYLKAVADITNKYGNDGSYKLFTAFYDENNSLKGIKINSEGSLNFDELSKSAGYDESVVIPDGADYARAFVWSDFVTLIPLSNGQIKYTNNGTFTGDGDEITVAFVGDSITHQAQYIKYVEHYYQTRYPNKKINFIIKGIGGNSTSNIINRFNWDILNDTLTGKPDEATLMIGTNDLARELYTEDENENADRKAAAINTYIKNIGTIIDMFKQNNVSLTLITPCALEDTEGFTQATGPFNPKSNSVGLKNLVSRLKETAQNRNIPIIDIWTPTTEIANQIRSTGYTGEIIAGKDRVHPNELGGLYMAYQIIKQQGGKSDVASVSIDAANGTATADNADVKVTSNSTQRVEYMYTPYSSPLAYTADYIKWENEWKVPLTEDLNREIIKVTNLADGNYNVLLNGAKIDGTFTAADLANGINIATLSQNPNQTAAAASFETLRDKLNRESEYRNIALTEQFLISNNKMTPDEIKNASFDTLTKQVLKLIEEKKNYTASYYAYIGKYSDGSDGKRKESYKPDQKENWKKLKALEIKAENEAKPISYSVVIEKAD